MRLLLVLVLVVLSAAAAEAGPLKRLKARRLKSCAAPVAQVQTAPVVSDCANGKCTVQSGRRVGWFGK